MTLGILDILIIFVVFCLVWIGTNIAWKIIEGKMLIQRQSEMMDKIYSKGIRLILQAIHDIKDIREVAGRDKM